MAKIIINKNKKYLEEISQYKWRNCRCVVVPKDDHEQDYMRYSMSAPNKRMHWTAGIVRRFKHFPIVKFILSLWHSLASRQ